MKKYLATILLVVSMLAMLTGTAAAAGSASLVSVVYVPGKGPVYTFEVSGKYSKADLEGVLQVNGGASFDLHCTQVDSSTVKCTSSKKAAGKNVTLSWGGGTFSASVPAAKDPVSYCYGVWDWDFYSPMWVQFATACGDTPASYGDTIDMFNPDWGYTDTYEFLPGSPDDPACIFTPVNGDAYYFPFCF